MAPRRPVLLAAASATELSVDVLAKAGISEVLRRPLSSTELAAALARWTSGGPRAGTGSSAPS
jgi:BarA-like signal transduction histidine kinase